jgi:hypothetical protein
MANNTPNKGSLNKGSEVYRSSTRQVGKNDSIAYFMFGNTGKNKVQQYYSNAEGSKVYTYKLKTTPNLIKMNSVHTVETILNRTNNSTIRNAILGSFSIMNSGNSKRIVRSSKTNRDLIVAKYICKLGYDGYIANTMNKVEGGLFHQELVLCKPYHKLNEDPEISIASQAPAAPAKKRRPIAPNSPPPTISPLKGDSRFANFSTPSPTRPGVTNYKTTPPRKVVRGAMFGTP